MGKNSNIRKEYKIAQLLQSDVIQLISGSEFITDDISVP